MVIDFDEIECNALVAIEKNIEPLRKMGAVYHERVLNAMKSYFSGVIREARDMPLRKALEHISEAQINVRAPLVEQDWRLYGFSSSMVDKIRPKVTRVRKENPLYVMGERYYGK